MTEPWMTPAIQQILSSLSEINEQLSSDDDEAEQQRFEEELAKKNRSGERGRDWAVLQSRIDLRQTSLSEIMSGADASPEARRVQQHAQKNLSSLQEEMSEKAKSDPEALDPLAENAALLAEMQQRVAQIKSRFGLN